MAICGLALMVFFFYYNNKLSKYPLFNVEVFNKSTIMVELSMLFASAFTYAERYVVPYCLRLVFLKSASQSGIFIAISCLSSFVFSPFSNFLSGKLICKRVTFVNITIILLFEVLNILELDFF